jgi:hypothetical protein
MESAMHSPDEIEKYRAMDPEERYMLFLELAAYAWHCLDVDEPERAKRKWDLIRRQHDESSRRLEQKFKELAS